MITTLVLLGLGLVLFPVFLEAAFIAACYKSKPDNNLSDFY